MQNSKDLLCDYLLIMKYMQFLKNLPSYQLNSKQLNFETLSVYLSDIELLTLFYNYLNQDDVLTKHFAFHSLFDLKNWLISAYDNVKLELIK